MGRTLLMVALGGRVGSALRYLTSIFVAKYYAHVFASPVRLFGSGPLATFFTNAIGCLLIGLFMGFLIKSQPVSQDLKWFLVTGFCGGYTTFSAFGYENVTLLQNGNSATAFAYIAGSILIGLAAVWLGLFLTR